MSPQSDLSLEDRRQHQRFQSALKVYYKLQGGVSGTGEVRDISVTGLRFRAPDALPVGEGIEVAVDWPVTRNGKCPLLLCGSGDVVRSDELGTAIDIEQFRFCLVCEVRETGILG